MKNLPIIALLLICSFSSQAQFDFGIKAGVNSSTLTFEDLESNQSINEILTNNKFGYHAGAYIRVQVLGIYLQPEFLYTQINSEIEVQESDGTTSTLDFALSRFDIPVNLGFKIGPASIFGGPVLSYNLNHPADILDLDYNGGTLGYQAGIGLTFGKFILDAKYEGSFQNIAEEVVYEGQAYTVDARTGQFIVSLGYAIF